MSSKMDCYDWMPSYSELPTEIILYIFRYLTHADRQQAGATCKRWYDALCYPEMNKDVMVRFSRMTLSDDHYLVHSFNQSVRPINTFLFEDISFGHIRRFLNKISKMARFITFDEVEMSEKQFWNLIRTLENLESLTLTHCSNLFMLGSSSVAGDINIENCMRAVRILSLRDNQYITDGLLSRVMSPIRTLESFDISGCHVAYHNAIRCRFYPNRDIRNPSDSVLTFMYTLEMLKPHLRHLRDLNLSDTLISSSSLDELTEIADGKLNLKCLRLAACQQLVPSFCAFLKTQPNLVILDVSCTSCINDDCVKKISEYLPMLETLSIAGCLQVTGRSTVALKQLKYLKRLNLTRCISINDDGIVRGIAAQENHTLYDLNLSNMSISIETINAVAKNLKALRKLNLSRCMHAVNDQAVQTIIEHLPQLTELSLEACTRITDAALTGINIAKLGLQSQSEDTSSDGSVESLNPVPNLLDNVFGMQNPSSMKISLRSKAEEEIVRDAHRKKAMMRAYELSLVEAHDIEGFSIENLRCLQKLVIKDCHKITDVSLKYGLKLKELRTLTMSKCQQITCFGISNLVQHSPAIEELDLTDCYNINDKAIQDITQNLKRLHTLHVSGCSQLTEHALDAIIVNCKNLKTLSIHRCRHLHTNIEDRVASMRLRNLNMDNINDFSNLEMFRKKKRFDY